MRVSHWSEHGMDAAHRKRARWHRAVEGVSRMQLILRSAHGKQKTRGGQQRRAQEQCWRTMLKLSQTHLHHEPSVISQRQRLQMRIKRVAKEGCLQCCVAVVEGSSSPQRRRNRPNVSTTQSGQNRFLEPGMKYAVRRPQAKNETSPQGAQ